MSHDYDRRLAASGPAKLPKRLLLPEARTKRDELFKSLGTTELEILRLIGAEKRTKLFGKPGDPQVLVSTSRIEQKVDRGGRQKTKQLPTEYTKKSWGREVTTLLKNGWLRWSKGPGGDEGYFHLTDAAETALKAMGEGKPPLITWRVIEIDD